MGPGEPRRAQESPEWPRRAQKGPEEPRMGTVEPRMGQEGSRTTKKPKSNIDPEKTLTPEMEANFNKNRCQNQTILCAPRNPTSPPITSGSFKKEQPKMTNIAEHMGAKS